MWLFGGTDTLLFYDDVTAGWAIGRFWTLYPGSPFGVFALGKTYELVLEPGDPGYRPHIPVPKPEPKPQPQPDPEP